MQHTNVIPLPPTGVRRRIVHRDVKPSNVRPSKVARALPSLPSEPFELFGSVRPASVEPALCRCSACGQTGYVLVLERAAPPCPACGSPVTVAT